MKIFYLPDLGEGLPGANILEWHIQTGDTVETDQRLVSVETAKAVVDIPAPWSGQIVELYGNPGETIATGRPLVAYAHSQDAGTVAGSLQSSDKIISAADLLSSPSPAPLSSVQALPMVRALAKRLSVDLSQLTGSGQQGQITAADVKAAASNAAINQQGFEPLVGIRRSMAQAIAQAHIEVPNITIYEDADINAWSTGQDITVRLFRALLAGCKAEPGLNAWYDGKQLQRRLWQQVHVGLAMDVPDGLLVPVIKDAAKIKLSGLKAQIQALRQKAQTRMLSSHDLRDSTIMLSNIGMFAGRYATPMVMPPCVAILASGKARPTVTVHQDAPVIHRILPLSLSFDHRAVTGAEAARFLAAVIQDLSYPD